MIIGIIGGMSSGKTATMSKFAYDDYKEGKHILANYNLHFEHNKIDSHMIDEYAKQKRQLDNVTICWDEYYLTIDSRSSSKSANKVHSYFALQTSKRNVKLIYTAQMFSSIDKRIRENTHTIIQCLPVLLIGTEIIPYIDETGERLIKDDVKENFNIAVIRIDKYGFGFNTLSKVTKYLIKGTDVFDLYDTKEIIDFS